MLLWYVMKMSLKSALVYNSGLDLIEGQGETIMLLIMLWYLWSEVCSQSGNNL